MLKLKSVRLPVIVACLFVGFVSATAQDGGPTLADQCIDYAATRLDLFEGRLDMPVLGLSDGGKSILSDMMWSHVVQACEHGAALERARQG